MALDAIHASNAILRFADRKLFAPEAGTVGHPLFIIGLPRSGTTLVYQILAHCAQVTYFPRVLDYAYGASNLAFRALGGRINRYPPAFESSFGTTPGLYSPSEAFGFWRRWFWKGPDEDHLHPSPLPLHIAADLHRAVCEIESHRRRPLLVKCLYLSLAVPALAAAIPESRFLYVRRDPVDAALSILRCRHLTGLDDWWSVRPPGYRELATKYAVADQVMWQVAETTTLLRSDLRSLPAERWRMVRYDELCGNPRGVLAELKPWISRAGYQFWPKNELPGSFRARNPRASANGWDVQLERLRASPFYERALAACS